MIGSDDADPIVVADGGTRCSHCGRVFDPDAAPSTSIPSATLLQCPHCSRWTEGPPPE